MTRITTMTFILLNNNSDRFCAQQIWDGSLIQAQVVTEDALETNAIDNVLQLFTWDQITQSRFKS